MRVKIAQGMKLMRNPQVLKSIMFFVFFFSVQNSFCLITSETKYLIILFSLYLMKLFILSLRTNPPQVGFEPMTNQSGSGQINVDQILNGSGRVKKNNDNPTH
jgi:hypothetical protein